MSKGVCMPREKLRRFGVDGLSDTDLVSIIVGFGVEGRGVLEVSRAVARMIAQYRSPRNGDDSGSNQLALTWKDFMKVRGVGAVKGMQLECAVELGKRFYSIVSEARQVIRCRSDVVNICSYLKKKKQEHVVVLGLNARNEIVGKKTVAIGSLNKAVVEPREILGWALSGGVSGVILVHNHPSGCVEPSEADRVFTEKVRKAAELLGIEFIDHVIV